MIPPFSGLEFGIVLAMFAIVTVLGFAATRWRRGTTLASDAARFHRVAMNPTTVTTANIATTMPN